MPPEHGHRLLSPFRKKRTRATVLKKKTLLRERTKPPGNGWAKCGAVIGKQLP
jgi:hypothetical protein